MATGRVKWWNQSKGYGFISAQDGTDCFAHYSEIEGTGFRNLSEGAQVSYTPVTTDKGVKATDIRIVEVSPAR
jgi:CspA family cold shock protein